jgi:NAD(P)H-nitrite reductase large subunit/rubredoxin
MSDSPKRWLCTVCGYAHEGPTPCDYCPICGATSELFDICVETPAHVEAEPISRWRCLTCEYLFDGSEPPAFCPVCGATSEHFEPLNDTAEEPADSQQALDIVIVGAGIAGVSAAEAAREHSSKARITLISREVDFPYYRLNLTRYLAGEIGSEDLGVKSKNWYDDNDIHLMLNTELQKIDTQNKTLTLKSLDSMRYDKLVLAMGSHPFVPPFPGANRDNVTVLRTRRDAEFILEQVHEGMPCVVIGGGLLGLETAGALTKRKADVTLIEGFDWLMPQQLNQAAGEKIAKEASTLGIKFCMGARVKQLEGDEKVRGVSLESGETIPAELVIITAGVRSNSYLARMAQIETNDGIVVDNELLTNNRDIYAIGDVAEHRGVMYGTWGPSQFQGTIAGMNAVGSKIEFAGIPRSNSLKVLGSEMFSIGQVRFEDGSYQEVEETLGDNYAYFLFRDSHMVGAILLGDTRLSATVKKLIEKKVQCSELLSNKSSDEEFCFQVNSFAATVHF